VRPVLTSKIPLLSAESMLDRLKGHNLLEEIEPVFTLGCVGKVTERCAATTNLLASDVTRHIF
jgi:hypothetical protein